MSTTQLLGVPPATTRSGSEVGGIEELLESFSAAVDLVSPFTGMGGSDVRISEGFLQRLSDLNVRTRNHLVPN